MEQKLCTLSPGQSGIITSVSDGGRNLSGRLRDLGFTSGSRITSVGKSPLGDPMAFRIRGASIALRREDAALVTVTPCEREEGRGR
ncbi:MAG: ferrous iron transport protein A [Clostridia bacterium]|nr:ferrous iron transport protein A [Clostridia bacterium]